MVASRSAPDSAGNPEATRLKLRADAEAILRAGIAGAQPAPLVQRALRAYSLGSPVRLLAIGKAAAAMARAAYQAVAVKSALVVAPAEPGDGWPNPAPRLLVSDHPIPGQRSVAAGSAVQAFLEQLTGDDVALVLLSGGGSALLTLPAPGLTLYDLAATTRVLMAAGADIHALNCVRRHLDDVKGGRLARLAAPAAVLCLALSDVPGDDPADIASGPFVPDPTTFATTLDVLRKYDVLERVPAAVRRHLEDGAATGLGDSLKPGDAAFRRVRFEIIGSNRNACNAAAAEARQRGYLAELSGLRLAGEARAFGERIGRELNGGRTRQPTARIFGGETTVKVRGLGMGGRNQELALAAGAVFAGNARVALGTAGTDGIDGSSPAAGAIVDGTTTERMRALGVDPERALAANDSYHALAAVGDALVTGPTGTNVMDLAVTLALP